MNTRFRLYRLEGYGRLESLLLALGIGISK